MNPTIPRGDASVERFDVEKIPAQPWKNGAGSTREIAVGRTPGHDFDWRISVAEVARNAPFSAFPGIDRCIVLLHGAGMRLRARDGSLDWPLTRQLAPFCFSGDVALDATIVDGTSNDFNVMTRRGAFCSEVTCHRHAADVPGAAVTLLLCTHGEWIAESDAPHSLQPRQALLWRQPIAGIKVRPAETATSNSLLVVRVCHDRGT